MGDLFHPTCLDCGRSHPLLEDCQDYINAPVAGEAKPVLPVKGWDDSLRGPRMSEVTGNTIFKYQMPVLESFTMELPAYAQIIRVADEGGMFWMWAVVNTEHRTEKRQFRAFKTGGQMPDDISNLRYIGFCAVFVQMELGLYIFEEVE
jgi:hypothetical protein